MPSILVLQIMITVTFGFHLLPLCSWFSNHLEPGQGKGTWPGFWPSRKLLRFSLSWTITTVFLCKSHLQSGPWLHPHDGNQTPSWALCAWLPGRRPCISDKTTFSSLYTLMCLFLPPLSSLLLLGAYGERNPACRLWAARPPWSFILLQSWEVQRRGPLALKLFASELHPIPNPGLDTW